MTKGQGGFVTVWQVISPVWHFAIQDCHSLDLHAPNETFGQMRDARRKMVVGLVSLQNEIGAYLEQHNAQRLG